MTKRLYAAAAMASLLALTWTAPAPAGDLSIGLLQWHRDPRPIAVATTVPYGFAGYAGAALYSGNGGCCGGGGLLPISPPAVTASGFYASAAGSVGSMTCGLTFPGAVVPGPVTPGMVPVALYGSVVSPTAYAPTPACAEVSASLARTAALVGQCNPMAGQLAGEAPCMSPAEVTAHIKALTRCVEGLSGVVQRHDAALNGAARAPKPE